LITITKVLGYSEINETVLSAICFEGISMGNILISMAVIKPQTADETIFAER
jgi:hypothetical protein